MKLLKVRPLVSHSSIFLDDINMNESKTSFSLNPVSQDIYRIERR